MCIYAIHIYYVCVIHTMLYYYMCIIYSMQYIDIDIYISCSTSLVQGSYGHAYLACLVSTQANSPGSLHNLCVCALWLCKPLHACMHTLNPFKSELCLFLAFFPPLPFLKQTSMNPSFHTLSINFHCGFVLSCSSFLPPLNYNNTSVYMYTCTDYNVVLNSSHKTLA